MSVNFPQPTGSYNPADESRFRGLVQQAFNDMRSRKEDVELTDGQRFIVRSPNGTRWALTVSDAGVVGAAAL